MLLVHAKVLPFLVSVATAAVAGVARATAAVAPGPISTSRVASPGSTSATSLSALSSTSSAAPSSLVWAVNPRFSPMDHRGWPVLLVLQGSLPPAKHGVAALRHLTQLAGQLAQGPVRCTGSVPMASSQAGTSLSSVRPSRVQPLTTL